MTLIDEWNDVPQSDRERMLEALNELKHPQKKVVIKVELNLTGIDKLKQLCAIWNCFQGEVIRRCILTYGIPPTLTYANPPITHSKYKSIKVTDDTRARLKHIVGVVECNSGIILHSLFDLALQDITHRQRVNVEGQRELWNYFQHWFKGYKEYFDPELRDACWQVYKLLKVRSLKW